MNGGPQRGRRRRCKRLKSRRGSCRDFATLMMEAARALGLAARFVTGYLYAPERGEGEAYLGGGSTHAWCQVYLPGAGWVEFDPTNGIVGSRDLIRVGVARDARQAIPLHGRYYGPAAALEGMTVSVDVRSLAELNRRRLPCTLKLRMSETHLGFARYNGIERAARSRRAQGYPTC